jgi:hypothetical protein
MRHDGRSNEGVEALRLLLELRPAFRVLDDCVGATGLHQRLTRGHGTDLQELDVGARIDARLGQQECV